MHTSKAMALAAVAALLLACGSSGSDELAAAADAISAKAVDPGNAGGNKIVKVMTRNLYIGADVVPFILGEIADPAVLLANVEATNYPLRAQALADEIAAERPDVVALQEAYRFEVGGIPIDYIDILLEELAARDLTYRKVVESTLLQLLVPIGPVVVGVTDRDAILVRDELQTANAEAHVFPTPILVPLPPLFPGLTHVPRGWVETDVKFRGEWFHFVNAHLEIVDEDHPELLPLQMAQAAEVLASLPGEGPVILVGDFNANGNAPLSPTYGLLTSALDEVIPEGSPWTCCQAPLLDNATSILDERVDLVLFRGPVTGQGAFAVGLEPALLEEGPPLWASDHAGVVASLRLWDPEFFALRE